MKFWLFCSVFVAFLLVAGLWLYFHPNDTAKSVLGTLSLLLLVVATWRLSRESSGG